MIVTLRPLARDEIDQIWTIDRSEVIHNIYTLDRGVLILKPAFCDARGWPPGEVETSMPLFHACFDRGGAFHGMFDELRLIGAIVIDSNFLGPNRDQLQVKFLYVSQGYRARGVGKCLLEHARTTARKRGAKHLYVSSTPSENTVNFYRRLGCVVAAEPDPELLALEPDDIHFLCAV